MKDTIADDLGPVEAVHKLKGRRGAAQSLGRRSQSSPCFIPGGSVIFSLKPLKLKSPEASHCILNSGLSHPA